MHNKEIECRFLEIDKEALIKKLLSLGAKDYGEKIIKETIIYDTDLRWRDEGRFLRVRKIGDEVRLAFKEHREHKVDGTIEIELDVDDFEKTITIFENIGFKPFRYQEKKRHTLKLNNVTFDIDTWPKIPSYVEFEGKSEEELKAAAVLVGYSWEDANFHNAKWLIENKYNIPVGQLKYFTFSRYE